MNKWFSETFLPSIFERCEVNKRRWLSQKQTAVCVRNMELHQARYDADGYGTMCTHRYYTCEWQGRKVSLDYSKKNGCGCIEFGFNAEELESHKASVEAERKQIKAERIERIKRNPERLERKIAELKKKLQRWREEYEADVADGFTEYLEEERDAIAEIEAELALYMA